MENSLPTSSNQISVVFIHWIYAWMAIGVLIAGVVAMATNYYLANVIYSLQYQPANMYTLIGASYGFLMLQALIGVMFLLLAKRMNAVVAAVLYCFYTACISVLASYVFYIWLRADISFVFFIAAFAFLGLSIVCYITKKDFKFWGAFPIVVLFGLIATLIYGFVVPSVLNNTIQLVITAIGVIVFSALIAFNTQGMKQLITKDKDVLQGKTGKSVIFGAFLLYIDFTCICLLLLLIRLAGMRRR